MIKAIVGANWGDEGKGKITDMLSQDARFRRTEGFAAEALFFVLVKKYVVRHQYLSSVGNQDVWLRDTLIDQRAYLLHEKRDIESDTVSQDIGDVLVENA